MYGIASRSAKSHRLHRSEDSTRWASSPEGSQRSGGRPQDHRTSLYCDHCRHRSPSCLADMEFQKASSSLREDEIMSIVRYSSRGFVPASQHLQSRQKSRLLQRRQLPDSRREVDLAHPRARLISFLAVLGLAGSSDRLQRDPRLDPSRSRMRRAPAVNFGTMNSVLEARGYGLILLFATLASVAFAQWSQTQSRTWLNVMAITCVLGTYTLPFYVVFGGSSPSCQFSRSPLTRALFLAGFLTRSRRSRLLYLPDRRRHLRGLPRLCGPLRPDVRLRLYVDGWRLLLAPVFHSHELLEIGPLSFVLLALAACAPRGVCSLCDNGRPPLPLRA